MGPFHLAGIVRFLLGILLVQAATGALVYAALNSGQEALWPVFGGLAACMGVLATFWFGSIVHHARKDAVAQLKDSFSREREKIRLQAERDKTRVIERSHKQLIRDRGRTEAKANAKVGASFAAVMGLGMLMLFTQFVTIGMLLMTTAGGALAGYGMRARQDYLAKRKDGAEKLIGPGTAGRTLSALKNAGARLLPKQKLADKT